MNKFLMTAFAAAFAMNVSAQSVQEGEKLVSYGRYESAKSMLAPLAAKDAMANYLLGIAQLETGQLQEAKATFEKFGDDFYNQAGVARVLFAEGKKDQAQQILLKIVDKAKKKEWQKYKAAADAITFSEGGNITDAIAWYQKAIEINGGTDAETFIHLGDAFLNAGNSGTNSGEAMSNFEKAIEKGTSNSLAHAKMGSLWYRARRYSDALGHYEKAKEADPSNPLPYRDLARAYQRAGKFDNALTNIKKYLELSDKSIDDQISYADLLFLTKNYTEAQTKIQELQTKGVNKPYLNRLVAYSAFETKDYIKARDYMSIFYAKQPVNKIIPEDYLYSGKIYNALATEDPTKALVYNDSANYYFNKLVAEDTASSKRELYLQLAETFKNSNNFDKAATWYGKITADDAENATALDYFYWGYYSFVAKDYPTAEKAFDAMKAKFPNEGSAFYWRARVAAAQDSDAKTGGAAQLYKDWLDFNAEGYVKKNADLNIAYQYLTYYYYNTNNEKEALTWANKILEIEPANEFATQIIDFYSKKKKS